MSSALVVDFRQQDRKALTAVKAAVRADVFGTQPNLSVEAFAAGLTPGADDPQPVTKDVLYKALEGKAKIPLHKLPALHRLSRAFAAEPGGGGETLRVLLRLCHEGEIDRTKIADIATALRRFAVFVEHLCAAFEEQGPGGKAVVAEENRHLQAEGDAIVGMVLGLKALVQGEYEAGLQAARKGRM